jgi:hypothetical protein
VFYCEEERSFIPMIKGGYLIDKNSYRRDIFSFARSIFKQFPFTMANLNLSGAIIQVAVFARESLRPLFHKRIKITICIGVNKPERIKL